MSAPAVVDVLHDEFARTAGGEPGVEAAVAETLARFAGDNLDAAALDALEDGLVEAMQRLRGRADRDPLGLVLTPPSVAAALGELLRVAFPGESAAVATLLDPASGTGRLLEGVPAPGLQPQRRVGWDVDQCGLIISRALASLRGRAASRGDLELSQCDGLSAARPATASGTLAIVCNPPFVAAYARRSQAASMDRDRLAEVSKGWGGGRLNTATAFVARVVRDLLRPGELFGFVLPDALLASPRYGDFRRALLEYVDALEVGRLPETAFPSHALRAVLVTGRRADRPALAFDTAAPSLQAVGFRTWTPGAEDGPSWGPRETLDARHIALSEACAIPWPTERTAQAFRLLATEARLDAHFEIADGVNPGTAEARAALVATSPRGLSAPRPLVEGKDVQPGHVHPPDHWVETDPARILPEWRRGGTSLRRAGLFDGPRVYSRQTASTLVCAYVDDDSMALNSVHVIRWAGASNAAAAQLRRLSAVLCTEVVTEIYQALFAEDRAAFPQVKIANLRALPLPWPPPPPLTEAADRWAESPSDGRRRHVEELTERWLADAAKAE